MVSSEKSGIRFCLHDFPVALSALLLILFGISWVLAVSDATALKPIHYTLFNFLLIALFALQKYRRFEMDEATQSFKLISIGVLSGKQELEGELSSITNLKVEPGIGGVSGNGGRLIILLKGTDPLVLCNKDILPGSHSKLERIAEDIKIWLEAHRKS